MRRVISLAIKHPLISGSSIIVVGSMFTSILNYLFNLGMGRLLSTSDYGTFASLISVFNIFSVFSSTIIIVFTKFAASFIGQKKEELIGPLLVKGNVLIGALSFVVCALLIVFSSKISNFLNISNSFLVTITSATLFFSFLASVGVGVLQGQMRFVHISLLNISTSLVKLILGILLVLVGLNTFGAIGAFFMASVFAYLFIFVSLRRFLKKNLSNRIHVPNLRKNLTVYAAPVLLSTLGTTAFITLDIILIKHFFSPEIAGQYAALSLMGRSIFYVVSPISVVLFPLIAQKKERKEKLFGTLLLSVLLTGLPSLILSGIYFTFPEFVINIFFPAQGYKVLAPLMGPFSILVLLYSLVFLLNSFYLSIGKIKILTLTLVGSIVEIIFIIFMHQSIGRIVTGLIVIVFLLLFGLLLYYPNTTKSK